MTTTHRFIVVPRAHVPCAREVMKKIVDASPVPGGADGVFTVGLSASGVSPASHFISTGLINAALASLLGDAQATFNAYAAAGGATYTLADIQALYAAATILSDAQGNEHRAIATLGLKLVTAPTAEDEVWP